MVWKWLSVKGSPIRILLVKLKMNYVVFIRKGYRFGKPLCETCWYWWGCVKRAPPHWRGSKEWPKRTPLAWDGMIILCDYKGLPFWITLILTYWFRMGVIKTMTSSLKFEGVKESLTPFIVQSLIRLLIFYVWKACWHIGFLELPDGDGVHRSSRGRWWCHRHR